MALHTTGKNAKEFSKYLKKKKKIGKRLRVRDDGVFGFWSFSFFSVRLKDGGDGPFLCEKVSRIIRGVWLDGHTLRDVDVDG